MKRIVIALIVIGLLLCSITIITLAHPGKTDSQGGHTDHSTGEYHYHHGYPAHQHTYGRCPYDYDNAEDDETSLEHGKGTSYHSDTQTGNTRDTGDVLRVVIAVILALICVAPLWMPWVESLWKWIKKLMKSNGSSGDE